MLCAFVSCFLSWISFMSLSAVLCGSLIFLCPLLPCFLSVSALTSLSFLCCLFSLHCNILTSCSKGTLVIWYAVIVASFSVKTADVISTRAATQKQILSVLNEWCFWLFYRFCVCVCVCVCAHMQMCVRPCRLIYILAASLSCLRMNYFSVILLVFPLPLLSLSILSSRPLSLPRCTNSLSLPPLSSLFPSLCCSCFKLHWSLLCLSTLPALCVFKLYLRPQTFPFCSSQTVPAHHHSPVSHEVTAKLNAYFSPQPPFCRKQKLPWPLWLSLWWEKR